MTAIIFLFGLIIGSFLNVCIYRIPRQQSIAFPGSKCVCCDKPLGFFELIPVISFIFLKGRCRTCGTVISWHYPMVEIITGIIFSGAYIKFGLNIEFLTVITLSSLMLVVTFIDIDYRIIPNKLVVVGLILGIVFGLFRPSAGLFFISKGIAAGFGLMFLVALLSRWQMGFGDVKLAAVMGAFLGWKGVLTAILLAFATGAVYGIFLIVAKGKNRKTAVPFGPFLAGATVFSFFWADTVITWYLNLIY
jgi:leader peptidase (prepilin peptidase)/N-methyltransferase